MITDEAELGAWEVLDFVADISDVHPQLPFIVVQRTIRKKTFDEIAQLINQSRAQEVSKGQVRSSDALRGVVMTRQTVFNLWNRAVERNQALQRWKNEV